VHYSAYITIIRLSDIERGYCRLITGIVCYTMAIFGLEYADQMCFTLHVNFAVTVTLGYVSVKSGCSLFVIECDG